MPVAQDTPFSLHGIAKQGQRQVVAAHPVVQVREVAHREQCVRTVVALQPAPPLKGLCHQRQGRVVVLHLRVCCCEVVGGGHRGMVVVAEQTPPRGQCLGLQRQRQRGVAHHSVDNG